MHQERWIADRALLYRLRHDHPYWTQPQLAQACGRSLGFVKKWLGRFRRAAAGNQSVLLGLSPRRKTPYPQTDPEVEERILAIRDEPPENLKRVPGPKAILYYLARDPALQARRASLPRSTRTIWKILRRHDRIAQPRAVTHQLLERPEPLHCWQIDFKDASSVPADPYGKQQHVVEILNVVDMGTSLLVASQVHANFHAQTALQAIAAVLQRQGMPTSLTLDRDPRWVGSASGSDFPSPFVRFLLCLGIEPVICPPRRPDRNAFVERYHRTLSQECLQIHRPQTEEQVRSVNDAFGTHYNQERPHQGRSCGNQPPRVAFPQLPSLPPVPQVVDPDAWLEKVHGMHVVRKVGPTGSVVLDQKPYYVKQTMAGQYVDLVIDATTREVVICSQGKQLKRRALKGLSGTSMPFEAFVTTMAQEALAEQRRLERARWQALRQAQSA